MTRAIKPRLNGKPISATYAVRMIEIHRATVLWGVPSYVRRVLLRALELSVEVVADAAKAILPAW